MFPRLLSQRFRSSPFLNAKQMTHFSIEQMLYLSFRIHIQFYKNLRLSRLLSDFHYKKEEAAPLGSCLVQPTDSLLDIGAYFTPTIASKPTKDVRRNRFNKRLVCQIVRIYLSIGGIKSSFSIVCMRLLIKKLFKKLT